MDYRWQHVQMARELGFTAAMCTAWGSAGAESDLWQVPRLTPWDGNAHRFALRLAANWRRVGSDRVGARAEPVVAA